MQIGRELYWNVGHSVLLPMYILVLLAGGVLVYGFMQRLKIYRAGKQLRRNDDGKQRLKSALATALTQKRVMRTGNGVTHGLFFFSFVVLAGGTFLVFLQADIIAPLFGWHFIRGNFYLLFSLMLDVAGGVALLALALMALRRFTNRVEGLPTTRDDVLMHLLLFSILISGFLVEGARMAATELVTQPDVAHWSPLGNMAATLFAGVSPGGLRSVHQGLWWGHFALVLGFIAIIPFTKFRHIFTVAANYFFVSHEPTGALDTIDMSDEEAESFGATSVDELYWKDIFDTDACTQCMRCQDNCPAYATEKPLSPMEVVNNIGKQALTDSSGALADVVSDDAIWSCTTCRACEESCPATIEHVRKIVERRRSLVLMEGQFPGDEVMTAVDNVEVNGNPLGMAFSTRGDWASQLDVVPLSEDSDVDIVYFVGCYASFDKRNIRIATAFVQLCNAAGLKVGILGKEEKCCGDAVRKLGNEYLYQMQAEENIAAFKRYDVKRIVTTCPHCFNTLSKDYRDLGLDVAVEHYTTFLQQLLTTSKLKLEQDPLACTYHDSCYLGRYNSIYQPPRQLLQAAGATMVEMARCEAGSFCCGAGGGRILAEEKLGSRISEKRVQMALDTGAPTLVSSCPFCLTMFEDGIKGVGADEQLDAMDIIEILAQRLNLNE